uniref:Uncharacterized protein n=1 Tax=Ixodes ricinus TaxID=34613 RepID=A0A147BNQ5_IXORI
MMRSTLRPAMAPASLVACLCESLKYAGTVITASLTFWPRKASAVSFILVSTMALISSGLNFFRSPLNSTLILGLPASLSTLKGQCLRSSWILGSSNFRPISRLASNTVFSGLRAVWALAASPMRRSVSVKAT